ncbi:PAS domain-containing protein [Fibrella aestuarina]|uniref:histidine kinase n=2 Tax=Fibrivirga algicola TaxID=2950420 RepID=A0ABX0QBS4_9BACT|nr:PAS domain-containing protein [Fibrivirga algicola]
MQDTMALLPCGIMVLNLESFILSLNPYACALLGYQEDELVGKRVDVILTLPSRIYFQTHLYPLIALKTIANELYLTLQTRSKAPIPVLINAVRQEHNGETLTFFSFMSVNQRHQYEQDLLSAKRTAENELLRNERLLAIQKKLEEHQAELDRKVSQLKQRNDELEQFGKIISHDLQEPLRKILVFADLLQQKSTEDRLDMAKMALSGIGKTSTRLRQLIRDLQLYFSQSTHLPQTVPVCLNEIVQQVIQEYESASVRFEVTTLPDVIGVEAELVSLFKHLIDNAVKFRRGGAGAVVHISGTVAGHNSFRITPDKYNYVDYAHIVVSDNGIGFNPRQRKEVFLVMKKLNPNTPGIGLGLALAKKIVERHNGQITAESAEGTGTTITVLLPVR